MRSSAARRLVEAATVAGATTCLFLFIYRPWGHRMRVPFSYGQDSLFYAMIVKSLVTYGNYGVVPSLGAPFGQNLYDFPQGADRVHHLLTRTLGLFIDDPYTIMNASFALSFVLIALSAHLVLRLLGVGRLVAAATSILFAFLPFHFWRGLQHPNLAAYFAVPLMVLLAVWVIEDGLPVLPSVFRSWDRRARWTRLLGAIGCAVVIAGSSAYYALFGILLVAAAGVVAATRRWSIRPLLPAAVVCLAIGAVMFVNLLPELRYRSEEGANPDAANRPAYQSEQFGLHLAQMVLPDPNHNIDALGRLGRRAASVPEPGEGGTYLGAVGVLGFAAALGLLARGRWGRTDPLPDVGPPDGGDEPPPPPERLLHPLGSLALVGFLISTVGGVGYLIAVLGFRQLRGWGRFSVVIAFVCLAIVAVLADHWVRRAKAKGGRWPAIAVAAVLGVTAVGLVDQVPANARPDYDAVDAVYQSDRGFYGQMEQELPDGSMVFQLPVLPFPESPGTVDLGSYDHLRGYVLGDDTLEWSAGGLSGREADWQQAWDEQPTPAMIDGLAAAGFDALYVDTFGYTDRGASLLHEIDGHVGLPAGISGNGRMLWWDLRPRAEELRAELGDDAFAALGEAVLGSVRVSPAEGIGVPEGDAEGPYRWMGPSGTIEVTNPGDEARPLELRLVADGAAGSTLVIEAGDERRTVRLDGNGTPVVVPFAAPPGASVLQLTTDADRQVVAGDDRDLRIQLRDVAVVDPEVEDALG